MVKCHNIILSLELLLNSVVTLDRSPLAPFAGTGWDPAQPRSQGLLNTTPKV